MNGKALTALCVLLLSVALEGSAAEGGDEKHVYCNVYTQSICFAIGSGDSSLQEIPADFTTYRITLKRVVDVIIYSGFQPAVPGGRGTVSLENKYERPSGTVEVYAGEAEAGKNWEI